MLSTFKDIAVGVKFNICGDVASPAKLYVKLSANGATLNHYIGKGKAEMKLEPNLNVWVVEAPVFPESNPQTVITEYAIRKNKIVWVASLITHKTEADIKFEIADTCNLPRESKKFGLRVEADNVAIQLAGDNPGQVFEVWNMDTMQKLTTVCFSPE